MKRPIRTASSTLRQLFNISESLGIKQLYIAEKAGITPQQISVYRAGGKEPGIMTVESLAHAIGYKLTLTRLDEDAGNG